MTKNEAMERLTKVFRNVFDDDEIVLTDAGMERAVEMGGAIKALVVRRKS